MLLACTGASAVPEQNASVQKNVSEQAGPVNITNISEPLPAEPNQTQNNSPELNASPEDLTLWNALTVANVENVCVQQAKMKAGSLSWAVQGCTCTETDSALRKQFTCSIDVSSALGSGYYANADCSLEERECKMATSFGGQTMTFDQMYAIYSG